MLYRDTLTGQNIEIMSMTSDIMGKKGIGNDGMIYRKKYIDKFLIPISGKTEAQHTSGKTDEAVNKQSVNAYQRVENGCIHYTDDNKEYKMYIFQTFIRQTTPADDYRLSTTIVNTIIEKYIQGKREAAKDYLYKRADRRLKILYFIDKQIVYDYIDNMIDYIENDIVYAIYNIYDKKYDTDAVRQSINDYAYNQECVDEGDERVKKVNEVLKNKIIVYCEGSDDGGKTWHIIESTMNRVNKGQENEYYTMKKSKKITAKTIGKVSIEDTKEMVDKINNDDKYHFIIRSNRIDI